MQQRRAEQVRRELIRLCHAGLDSRTLRIECMKQLRTVIPIDLSFFSTLDPATLLFTGAVVDEILQRATPQFIENEFLAARLTAVWTESPRANRRDLRGSPASGGSSTDRAGV